jgi:NAD(P)-dependent dehydrogenase (short-subunit alcohol dehydrogenase family)
LVGRLVGEITGSRSSSDLSSQASIREFAETFRRSHDHLDVLVNCAGAFFRRRRVTVDGLEMTFALNHLAYFLLTNLLLDSLERSGSARVLNVTAPATTKIDFDDLQGELAL